MLWMLLLLLAAGPVWSDDAHGKKDTNTTKQPAKESSAETDEPVYDLEEGIKPPRLVHQVNPDYTGVRGVRVKGSVELALVVTSQGATRDVRVVQSLQPEVDRCAMEAVKQWRFAPAQKDGKSVAVHVTVELDFHSM